jgi:hypothetical protein
MITIETSLRFRDASFKDKTFSSASKMIRAQRSSGKLKSPEDIAGMATEVQPNSSLALTNILVMQS